MTISVPHTDGPLIVLFPGTTQTIRAEVGGKAASLIRMMEAGFPVPSGAVLTTAFFAPWFTTIKASAQWTRLVEATPDEWTPVCEALKQRAESLPLTSTQQDAFHGAEGEAAVARMRQLFAAICFL